MATVKCILAAATLVVLLVSMQSGRTTAACATQTIVNDLAVCISVVNQQPDPKGQCCASLRTIHDSLKPDDACICSIMTQPAVTQLGLSKEKAANFINVCVGASAVPSCLA